MTRLTASPDASTSQRSTLKGVLLILLGAFCFSTAPIFARSVIGYATAAIAFYRALVPVLFFGAITGTSPARRGEADMRLWRGATRFWILALGLAMGLTSLFYTHAYLHTTVARAVLLNYTAPLYVAVLGPWLLHEQRPRYAAIAVPLGVIGIALITDPGSLFAIRSDETSGVMAGVASGVCYAAVFMISRYLADKVHPVARTLLGSIVMMSMFLPWGITVPRELFWHNLPWLVGIGFFAMALPYYFIFAGQRYVTAQVGSMTALFEPVCGIIIGYLVYAEKLSLVGLAGAVAILVSIYLTSR